VFRAKGEKPRFGLFEDNILVSAARGKQRMGEGESESQLLHMIPEMGRRRKNIRRKSVGKSVNPSTNSTSVTFKVNRRSNSKSQRR
jgi:hypothetical protein